jgi:Putative transposase
MAFSKTLTKRTATEPLEFMERLVALVPRPRLHLIRFHGVLAPNAKLRRQIVPAPAERAAAPSVSASINHFADRRTWLAPKR